MECMTFLVKILPGRMEEVRQRFMNLMPGAAVKAISAGALNLSVWRAEDMIFGYFEADADSAAGNIIRIFIEDSFNDTALLIASPGNMRLMYSAIGSPREDKSSLKHRVFITRLKSGCAEVYKSRHDTLAASQLDKHIEGPVNNFTIWNAGDYICGYSEIDHDYIPDNSEKTKKASAAWETRMLEIMDWITDDVDDISGKKHNKIECQYK